MFDLILKPVVSAVRSWMASQVYAAAQDGAKEGLRRFAADLSQGLDALPAPGPNGLPADPGPKPLPMPTAARVTEEAEGVDDAPCPAVNVPLYERLRELVRGGLSQREAARQLGIPESTARGWLKKDVG